MGRTTCCTPINRRFLAPNSHTSPTSTTTFTTVTYTVTETMTTIAESTGSCMICPVGSLQPDVIATQPQDPPGTIDYTCQSAQNWLNAPSTTTACADGRAYWRTTCCTITLTSTLTMTTTTATLTTTTTLCLICPNEGFRRNAVANQPQDPPVTSVYTCTSAQDWLNAPSTTVTCASGQAFWNTTCCIPRPSQAPSPAPSPAPSRAPSPAPVDHVPHREPVDVERVRSEIR